MQCANSANEESASARHACEGSEKRNHKSVTPFSRAAAAGFRMEQVSEGRKGRKFSSEQFKLKKRKQDCRNKIKQCCNAQENYRGVTVQRKPVLGLHFFFFFFGPFFLGTKGREGFQAAALLVC
jgi:hypothetical protein